MALGYAEIAAVSRILLQNALPVAFGLRIARCMIDVADTAQRLRGDDRNHARIRFEGTADAKVGIDGASLAIASAMENEPDPAVGEPWHARRAGIAAIGPGYLTPMFDGASSARAME